MGEWRVPLLGGVEGVIVGEEWSHCGGGVEGAIVGGVEGVIVGGEGRVLMHVGGIRLGVRTEHM